MKINKIVLPLLLVFALCSCNKEDPLLKEYKLYGDVIAGFLPEIGETKLLFKHSLEESVGDDGEDYFYNYCPSIKVEDDDMHVYYCTNEYWANVTDYIGYRTGKVINNKLHFKDEELVLGPTPDTWDLRHVCDPSVVKGEFKYEGETYNYLMAYLGCVPSDCTLNETGIAVSKNPNGPWIKCNTNRVSDGKPINPLVPYSDFDCNEKSWGTGQASLVSVDKKGRVILFTTVGCKTGSFMDVREYDLSDISEYKLLRTSKVFTNGIEGTSKRVNNGDYCYDPISKRFYMAKGRSPFGEDKMAPNFVADIVDLYYVDASKYENPFDVFFDNETVNSWVLVGSIDKNQTGYPRNHNTGLVTDEYAHMFKGDRIGVATTSSQYGSEAAMTYLKTYRIFVTTFKI